MNSFSFLKELRRMLRSASASICVPLRRCSPLCVPQRRSSFICVHLWQIALLALAPTAALAQAPNEKWRTLDTPHFHVHFPLALEQIARRAGGSAERAYGLLQPHIKAPRGRIDLVVTDHVDYSNGYAYVSPSPRMVVFARPPVDERTLRFRDDWLDLVIQHELVHVFHLDRTRGWWRVAQMVFGRQPLLFPNASDPSWLLEGLAVYYESKLGDGGRLEGMAHQQYVNAKALDGALPRLGEWSVATLDFPGGTNAYVFGSLFVQSMSDRTPGGVERFVERSSGRLLPWAFDGDAKRAFGVRFSEQWKTWRDSVMTAVSQGPKGDAQGLTRASWLTRFPRVAPDGRLLFVASNGRDVAGLYELPANLKGAPRRVARRNSLEPNVELRDGRVIFAQMEYEDPWRMRSDLWVREKDGTEHALTHGARLFAPDARATDGAIVAVQNVAGSTRVVRVSDAGVVTPLTGASLDTTFSAPRWSHDGTRIAAVRWERGGAMSIVLLDPASGAATVLVSRRGVLDNPSWTSDDRTLLFAANVDGASRLWSVDVASRALRAGALAVTSFDVPELTNSGVVSVETRGTGERLALSPAPSLPATLGGINDAQPSPATERASEPATGAVQPYRPLRQLVPRYWLPSVDNTDENNTRYGATIVSDDIVGRHFYSASIQHEPTRGENTGSFVYRYAGLGLPLVDVAFRQTWDHTALVDSTNAVAGALGRRRRFMGTSLTFIRQRVRSVALLAGAAELELRDFVTDPAPLINQLGSPLFLRTLKYPTFTLYAGWGNTRQPTLAIGPEDGVSLSGSARLRWRTDDRANTRSTTYIGAANLYKSLPFPGSAHQVVALHGVAGVADDKTNTELEAGGVSGSQVELAPGILVGDVRRTFYVRGFPPGAQRGIRALGGSAEYRAPLAIPSWGSRFVPFFAQRVSAIVYGDAGAAWCPAGSRMGVGCMQGPTPRQWMASVGGELVLDAAVFNYDMPYRLRAGYAKPVQGRAYSDHPDGSVYFSLGASF